MSATPEVIHTIAALRSRLDAARADGATVGFVPTMGFLHEGHGSLIEAARSECDLVVVSIFVNPLQFAPDEDLDAYPRDLTGDTALAASRGTDIIFAPTVAEMYPTRIETTVTVAGVSHGFESGTRPTHFAGVSTVVCKLFSIVGTSRAYFGEKDFQQLAVVRRMTSDLSLPVTVVGCPTVREPDGLALSSRNVYLTAQERPVATVLQRALQAGAALILDGVTDPAAVCAAMDDVVRSEPLGTLDYTAVVDAATFDVPSPLTGELRLLGAVRFGGARLIDNIGITTPDTPDISVSTTPRGDRFGAHSRS